MGFLDGEPVVKQVSYGKLFCTARVIFASLAATFYLLVYCSFEPTLSLRLVDYPELTSTTTGLVFGIMPAFYMIATLIAPYIPE